MDGFDIKAGDYLALLNGKLYGTSPAVEDMLTALAGAAKGRPRRSSSPCSTARGMSPRSRLEGGGAAVCPGLPEAEGGHCPPADSLSIIT